MPLRLLHLVGSAVSDFYAELSRLYAADCLNATADADRYESLVAHVTPDGAWRFPAALDEAALVAAPALSVAQAIERIVDWHPDVVVPQMFCVPGMTVYRGLFDVLRIPYVGNAPDVMALAANKARARAVVASARVRVPEGELLRPGQRPSLLPPVVVKPVDTDNSLGISMVRTPEEYDAAVRTAFEHGPEVLVERYVELGREVRCGIVVRGEELVCLPLEEYDVDPARKPIRDHEDKIGRRDDGQLKLEAKTTAKAWMLDPSDPITPAVWAAARRCHEALNCRDYSLFDFRIDPDGQPWFLEAGLYNSFARQSVVTMMAAAAGIPLPDLFATAIEQARARG